MKHSKPDWKRCLTKSHTKSWCLLESWLSYRAHSSTQTRFSASWVTIGLPRDLPSRLHRLWHVGSKVISPQFLISTHVINISFFGLADCDETLQKFYGELKVMDGWCDQTQKLRQELDLNQGVNIVEIEESEEWRGILLFNSLDMCASHTFYTFSF